MRVWLYISPMNISRHSLLLSLLSSDQLADLEKVQGALREDPKVLEKHKPSYQNDTLPSGVDEVHNA